MFVHTCSLFLVRAFYFSIVYHASHHEEHKSKWLRKGSKSRIMLYVLDYTTFRDVTDV